ncbi:MAG: hypothetical protein QOI54_702 [Actinomycetota bacterium]|nr:hypothetical protein [Actinomycetota bacterium]
MGIYQRLGAGILALGVAIVGVVFVAPAASAHANAVTGVSTCQPDGTYTVTWTIANDYNLTEVVNHVSHDVGTVNGLPAQLGKKATATVTSLGIPGTAKSASLKVKGTWSDGFSERAVEGTVRFDKPCAPTPSCLASISTKDVVAAYLPGDPFHATVAYKGGSLCDGVTKTVSLNSYATDGGSWPTSGTQVFVDHDQVTLSKDKTSGSLSVQAPSCYYQTDLYFGDKRYDGKNGAVPNYPGVVTPENLVAARNGGHACDVMPSGTLTTNCYQDKGKVVASALDKGTFAKTVFRLVTGTGADHSVVMAKQAPDGSLMASGLSDNTKVWLQYNTGKGWVDEGSTVTTDRCTPVQPAGQLVTDCFEDAGRVKAVSLEEGTYKRVQWRLVTGTDGSHLIEVGTEDDGKLVAKGLADGSKVWLQVNTGRGWSDTGSVITTGACAPVSPVGDVVTDCYRDAGVVKAVRLDDGSYRYVAWRLVTGDGGNHARVLAQEQADGSLVATGLDDATKVWLQYRVNGRWVDEGSVVTSGTCVPTGSVATECVRDGGSVTATLNAHDATGVQWRLVTGTDAAHDTVVPSVRDEATLVASHVADTTKVWLQYGFGGSWTDVAGARATTPTCVPSGALSATCVENAGRVVATLAANDATGVQWRLVTGTDAAHSTVVPSRKDAATLVAANVADATKVWLQYGFGGSWSDVAGGTATTGACTPPVVSSSGKFTVACSADGADVTLGRLNAGTNQDVVWTLTYGATSKTVVSGEVVAVPAAAALVLAYKAGPAETVTVQTDTAPAACVQTGTPQPGTLNIVKSVDETGDATFGDTLTYRLVVTASGATGQTNVVVSDYIPGYKPGTASGLTTYVASSAACDAGTCTVAYDATTRQLTWSLGGMAAGTSRTVTFRVVIDHPAQQPDGAIPAVTILNTGAVQSSETASKPSNEVQTPVTAVSGVKQGRTSGGTPVVHTQVDSAANLLPHTGMPLPMDRALAVAVLLLGIGVALTVAARRREVRITRG